MQVLRMVVVVSVTYRSHSLLLTPLFGFIEWQWIRIKEPTVTNTIKSDCVRCALARGPNARIEAGNGDLNN